MVLPRPCNLLAVVGQSPAIVTETVWALMTAPDRPVRPVTVKLVTTAEGERFIRAQLFGEAQTLANGQPVRHAGRHWDALDTALREHYGVRGSRWLPKPEVLVATHPETNQPLEDIRDGEAAAALANLLYDEVHHLTREEDVPLVVSIAGGRKTMSADLQTAFSVHARPQDRLVHVLVSDPALERTDFFFPTSDQPARIDLVEVRVPRLRRLLERELAERLPEGRRDLTALLEVLEPFNYTDTPARAEVVLGLGARSRLRIVGTSEGVLGELPLSAAHTGTLLCVVEMARRHEGTFPSTALLTPEVVRQRKRFQDLIGGGALGDRWSDRDTPAGRKAVGTAISNLNRKLAGLPVARDTVGIETIKPATRRERQSEPVRYGLARPNFEVMVLHDAHASVLGEAERWPFQHLAVPRPDERG